MAVIPPKKYRNNYSEMSSVFINELPCYLAYEQAPRWGWGERKTASESVPRED